VNNFSSLVKQKKVRYQTNSRYGVNANPQIKVHLEAGLNVGLSRREITEVIIQMSVYADFPATLNDLFVAK
jgi:alkylhydroperoxidase/carboxymuconolactone decarboxylase family protein YurZ